MEADLATHSGPTSKGHFVHTLTVTNIATGCTECAPVLVGSMQTCGGLFMQG